MRFFGEGAAATLLFYPLYKGLVKNTVQLFSLFGLANLMLARKLLLASEGSNPS